MNAKESFLKEARQYLTPVAGEESLDITFDMEEVELEKNKEFLLERQKEGLTPFRAVRELYRKVKGK